MVFDLGRGGICPWCGSDRSWGRSGYQQRHCEQCHVTFDRECPFCHSIHNSWTWNPKEGEFGCDRCHRVASPDELKLNRWRHARHRS